MLRSAILHVVMSLLFTGLGLAAGWKLWRPRAAAPVPAPEHLHAPVISPQARKNLGIEMGEIKATPWTRSARFPATIEVAPGAEVKLSAPAAGRIVEVRKRAGALVAAGEVVATLKADGSGETISITAPSGPPDWDIVEQAASPDLHVEAGATLIVLRDSHAVRVQAASGGEDAAHLLEAVKSGVACEASPLVAGSGPALTELTLVSAENTPGDRLIRVTAAAANEPLAVVDAGDGAKVRTWKLRPGMRYVLRVPLETVKRTYVVPADAVADDGPDKVVFLQSGDAFLPEKVVVLHRDAEIAVLDARSSAIAPGDVYVARGAFALSLALRAGSNATGHTHPH